MITILLISLIAIIHFSFIVFIIFGGLVTPMAPMLIWAHIICGTYGVLMMTVGWRCPLSQWEAQLRAKRGHKLDVNEWEFLAHYFFRHIGLRGNEWSVTVVFVTALIGFNFQPYQQFISGS